MRALASALTGAAIVVAAVLLPAPSASAHASLVSSNPQHGETLTESPAAVEVELSEPVTLYADDSAVGAVDESGERVDAGDVHLSDDRRTVVIPLEPDLPDGVYLVSWRVISADTHPMGGSIQFGVNVPATLIEPPAIEPDRGLSALAGLVKALVYFGLVAGLGVPFTARILGLQDARARRARTWGLVGLAVAAVASLLQAVVQFLWLQSALGAGPFGGEPVDPAAVADFLGSTYVLATGVRLVLLAVAAGVLLAARSRGTRSRTTGLRTALARAPRVEAALLAALTLVVAATVGVNGHGGAGQPWQLAAVAVHGAAAIVWLGGLAVLALLLLRRRLDAVELRSVGAWSLTAGIAVALIVASGLVQAVERVGFVGALWSTSYGVVLLIKLALVVAALVLGAWGFVWARRESAREDGMPAPGQTARLRRRVTVELALGLVVIVLSGILSTLTPASAEYAPVTTARAEIGPYAVDVTILSTRTGPQRIRVNAVSDDADVRPPSAIIVSLSSPGNGVEGLTVDVPFRITEPVAPDVPTPVRFESTPVNVPLPGEWQLLVTLEVDEWTRYSGEIVYDVEG